MLVPLWTCRVTSQTARATSCCAGWVYHFSGNALQASRKSEACKLATDTPVSVIEWPASRLITVLSPTWSVASSNAWEIGEHSVKLNLVVVAKVRDHVLAKVRSKDERIAAFSSDDQVVSCSDMKRIGAISAAKSVIVAISHSEKVLAVAASEDVAVAVAAGNEGVITLTAVEYGGPLAGPNSIIALPTEDLVIPVFLPLMMLSNSRQ